MSEVELSPHDKKRQELESKVEVAWENSRKSRFAGVITLGISALGGYAALKGYGNNEIQQLIGYATGAGFGVSAAYAFSEASMCATAAAALEAELARDDLNRASQDTWPIEP